MIIFGSTKTEKPRIATGTVPTFPNNVDCLILSMPIVKGKGFNRRFIFNAYAEDQLGICKQLTPELRENDKAFMAFDAESKELYLGFYDEVKLEKYVKMGAKIPFYEISKGSMSFSCKELYEALVAKYNLDVNQEHFFELTAKELEGIPMFVFTPMVAPVQPPVVVTPEQE